MAIYYYKPETSVTEPLINEYSPDYIYNTSGSYVTTCPYVLSNTASTGSLAEKVINTYYCNFTVTNATCYSCYNIYSDLSNINQCLLVLYNISNGATFCFITCRQYSYILSQTTATCSNVLTGEYCTSNRYNLINQCSTSDINFKTLITACNYANLCNDRCCCVFNCCIDICICPSENCVYTNLGTNYFYDFSTHGYLKQMTLCKYISSASRRCGTGSYANSCYLVYMRLTGNDDTNLNIAISNAYVNVSGNFKNEAFAFICDTGTVITGNNLTEYDNTFCYSTALQCITLPETYKKFVILSEGFITPIGTTFKYNYCIPGVCNYTDQENFSSYCLDSGFNCIQYLTSTFCVTGESLCNFFSYATCTNLLGGCYCLSNPKYCYYVSVCNKLLFWKEIDL